MAAIANKLYLLAKQKPMDCRFPENDAYHRDEIEYKTHASNSLHFQRLSLSVRNFFSSLSCGAKTWNISGVSEAISDAISPARHPQKSSQHARACAAGDGAICSKNRIIVPYHGDNPNIWNGARLRSPSPIMAPDITNEDNDDVISQFSRLFVQTVSLSS